MDGLLLDLSPQWAVKKAHLKDNQVGGVNTLSRKRANASKCPTSFYAKGNGNQKSLVALGSYF